MTKLTRKDTKLEWSDDCQSGFEYLKTCLTKSLILKYPNPQKRYVVFTDASDQAAAAVLALEYKDDDKEINEMPIAYLSAQFSNTQFKWRTAVKEGMQFNMPLRNEGTTLKMQKFCQTVMQNHSRNF